MNNMKFLDANKSFCLCLFVHVHEATKGLLSRTQIHTHTEWLRIDLCGKKYQTNTFRDTVFCCSRDVRKGNVFPRENLHSFQFIH